MKGGDVVLLTSKGRKTNHMEMGKQMFGNQMFAGPIFYHGTQ